MDVVSSPAVQLVATNTSDQPRQDAGLVTLVREEKSSPFHESDPPAQQIDLESQIGQGSDAHNRIPIAIDFDNTGISPPQDDFPEGGLQAWLVLIGAFLGLYASFGFMVSIGTIQEYLQTNQLSHYTARDVGWIPSVFVYLSLGLGIWVGPLFDRYGPRWIALSGSISYIAMMFLLAECKVYWHFLLCLGVLGGIGGATLCTTGLAVVSHWFKRRRGMAHGVAMVGSSLGGTTIPLILRSTLPKYGYAWSIRILGFIFLGCLVVANVLMKPRLPPSPEARNKRLLSLGLFGDLKFTFLTITVFGFEIVLFGALGILPTYANYGTDYPADTGFYIIAVMNGVSCFGRIIPGYISDKIGRFNTLMIMIVFTLIIMLVLWLPFGHTSLAALYAFTALFGFGTGSWMALTPACIGQLCEADQFGRYYGTLYFVASLATLIGVPISGELVEAISPQVLVAFMCAILGLSLLTFILSRWACLGWKWDWRTKV
jgi:MFS family permease